MTAANCSRNWRPHNSYNLLTRENESWLCWEATMPRDTLPGLILPMNQRPGGKLPTRPSPYIGGIDPPFLENPTSPQRKCLDWKERICILLASQGYTPTCKMLYALAAVQKFGGKYFCG
jgi:hypothetical protein